MEPGKASVYICVCSVAFAEHLRPRCAGNENKGGAQAGPALPLPRFVKEESGEGGQSRRGLEPALF